MLRADTYYILKKASDKIKFLAKSFGYNAISYRMIEERKVEETATAMLNSLYQCSELDVQSGLSRVRGNEKLLRSLLVELYRQCETAPRELKNAIENGELEDACRLAHTIKGVAGNLGANSLAAAAEEMESEINQGRMTDRAIFVGNFDCAINALLDGLKDFVMAEEKILPKKIDTKAIDLVSLSTLLCGLKRYVQKGMPIQCRDILIKLDNLGIPEEHHRSLIRLENLISAYKFGEAKLVVDSILANISKNDFRQN